MAGYTRISPNPFVDGATITGSLFVNEFNAVEAAFDASAGHNHNGVGEGAPITVLAADALTFGANSSSDVVITFNTSGNDGTLTWDQSESTFDFGASGITTTGVFEAGNIDVNDITANGLIVTSNGDDIELDAGSGRVIVNATHTNQALTVRSTAAASTNDGPEVHIFRDATGSSGTHLGSLKFRGQDSGGTTRDFGRVLGYLRDASSTAPTGRIFIECLDGSGTLASSLTIDHNKVALGNSSEVVDLDVSGDVYIQNTKKLILEDTSGNESFSIRTTNNNVTILEETGSGNLEIKGDAFVIKANDNNFSKIVVHDEAGVKILSEVSGDTSDSYNRIQVGNQHSGTRFFCGTNETNVIAEVVTEGFNVYGDPNTSGTDVNIESTTGPAKLNITSTYSGGTEWQQAAGIEIDAFEKAYIDLKNDPEEDINMRMLHDGNSYVISATGNMAIKTSTANTAGSVLLQEGSTTKLQTTATGIDVPGEITTDGLESSADVKLTSNNQLLFGDDESFQIWQGSSNSIIKENNSSKNLVIQGNIGYLRDGGGSDLLSWGVTDGVQIYDTNGTERLQATTSGINVTGTVTPDRFSLTRTGASTVESLGIYTDSNNDTFIEERDSDNGSLKILGTALEVRSNDLKLMNRAGTEVYFEGNANSSADLYHNNLRRLSTTSDGVEIYNADTGSSAGPILNLNRASNSPANNDDLGRIQFKGNDSFLGSFVYGGIECDAIDVANGQATGQLSFKLLVDSVETSPLIFSEGKATFNTPIVGHVETTIESSTTNKNATATTALANRRTVYTGAGTTEWTLPFIGASSIGATLSIVNAGTGAITLDRTTNAVTIKILDGTTVSAGTADVIIATGGVMDLVVTGTNEYICFGSGLST